MAYPNSYYAWVMATLWSLKHFVVSLGTREVIEAHVANVWDDEKYFTVFNGLNGPYLLLDLWYTGYDTLTFDGAFLKITVDGQVITPAPGSAGAFPHLRDQNKHYIGRDNTWLPLILAQETLKIGNRDAYTSGRGGTIWAKIMRFGT